MLEGLLGALPFLHFAGGAAALAVPGLGFLTGNWRLYLGIALALVILLTIGGMWIRIDDLKVDVAHREKDISDLRAAIEATKAAQAAAVAEANAKAVSEMQRQLQAERAITKRTHDALVNQIATRDQKLEAIRHAKSAHDPIVDSYLPFLAGVR